MHQAVMAALIFQKAGYVPNGRADCPEFTDSRHPHRNDQMARFDTKQPLVSKIAAVKKAPKRASGSGLQNEAVNGARPFLSG
jgi:hypothetical protein